jgi:hypothetical protein
MSVKEVNAVLVKYQASRIKFSQTVAEMVKHPRNIEGNHSDLVNLNMPLAMVQSYPISMDLLRPLLLDSEPTIQQNAALAFGRLANYNEQVAERIIMSEILPQLVASLNNENV